MSKALSGSPTFQALVARVAVIETGTFSGALVAPSLVTANVTADTPSDNRGGVRLLQSSVVGKTGIVEFLKSDGTRNGYLGFNLDAGAMQYGSDTGTGHVFAGGTLNVVTMGTYANNAAAVSGGLAVGDFYRTSTGQLMVRY